METMEEEMPTEIAVKEVPPPVLKLTAAEIKADVNLIQQVLKAVMKKDVHYGVIPGTTKPTLYKPGAEKILSVFRLNAVPTIEDLSTPDEIRYRVSIRIVHQISLVEIGWGVGECSSNETKYKWIAPTCDAEWDDTPEDKRRTKWKKDKTGKAYATKQIRANLADVANTVLKMSKKRSLVDGTLTCTAASDVFDQDLEDLPEALRQNMAAAGRPPMPQRMSEKAAATVAQQEYPDEDPNDSVEDPPAPAAVKDPRKAIDVKSAKVTFAKFDAPCRVCNVKIVTDAEMLYVGDGPDKGRYHKACVRQA